LVKAVQDSRTQQVRLVERATIAQTVPIKPEHLSIINTAMIDVMRPGGTGAKAGAGATYAIAGKTGTAQVRAIKQGESYDASKIEKKYRDHALFVAYAPADNPKIALAVLVENGGGGGSVAAPIAREVFDYYLLGIKKKQDKSVEPDAEVPQLDEIPEIQPLTPILPAVPVLPSLKPASNLTAPSLAPTPAPAPAPKLPSHAKSRL
jgi:penicillin-binding protein 2